MVTEKAHGYFKSKSNILIVHCNIFVPKRQNRSKLLSMKTSFYKEMIVTFVHNQNDFIVPSQTLVKVKWSW